MIRDRYEKIRTKDGKVYILKNTEEIAGPIWGVRGTRVDKDGNSLKGEYRGGVLYETREIVILAFEDIGWRKPMVMSNYYGELVYLDQRV